MFSKRFYIIVWTCLFLGSLMGAIPFRFEWKSKKFVFAKFISSFYKFNVFLVATLQVFMAIQTTRLKLTGRADYFNLSYAFNIGSGVILTSFMVACAFLHELLATMNAFLVFFDQLYKKYRKNFHPENERASLYLELTLVAIISNLMGTSLLVSIVFAIFPKAPILFGNVIPDEYFTLPVRILQTIYFTIVSTVIYANLAAVISIIIIYTTQVIPFVTKELRMVGVKRYKFSEALRTPQNIMVEYRRLEILHLCFMKIIGYLLVPIHSIIVHLVLFCNFVVILHRDENHPAVVAMLVLWSTFGSVFWSIVLQLGGHAYSNGRKVKKSWKLWNWGSRANNRMMSKFSKSCRPFMLNYGSTYVIGRRSILKFLRGLTRGTFRVLLTMK